MPAEAEYNLFTRFMFRAQPGVGQMGKVSRAFASLQKRAKMARMGVQQMGMGVRNLAIVGAGLTAVLGTVIKKGAEFNKQMSVVQSVTKVGEQGLRRMKEEAMRLGASTSFTAKQAGEGMEHLARAGFNAGMVIKAINPTLRMAEADSMELGTAAQIVAASLKAFGLEAGKSANVADALAYVSARSNTNVTMLGEALKYTGTTARFSNQSFEETVGALGLLANVGIRGSLAGTALKNAFLKLTRGTKAAQKVFGGKKGLTEALTDDNQKMISLNKMVKAVIDRLAKVPNQLERTSLAFKIFGIRGKATMDAFNAAMEQKRAGGTGPKDLDTLMDNISVKSKGMAMAMSKMRLDNLAGDWTIFKSAMDNVAISIGSMLEPELRKLFGRVGRPGEPGGLVGSFQSLGKAVNDLNQGMSETTILQKYGNRIGSIALGIKEAFTGVREALVEMGQTVKSVFERLVGSNKGTIKSLTKTIAKFIMWGTVLTPIIAGVAGIGIAASGMFNVLVGGFRLISALTSGWGIALLAIMAIFSGTGKKGETTFEKLARGLKNLTKLAYALTYPFRLLIEYLGPIKGLLAGVVGYKLLKGGGRRLLGGIGGRMAARGGMMGSIAGRFLGRAGATGMPVYVTNWGEAGGLLGGGLGGLPLGAGKAGLLARGGLGAAGAAGAGKAGLGISGALGVAKSAAAVTGTLSAVGLSLGFFGAALSPAIAGLKLMGEAYTEAGRKKKRKELLSGHNLRVMAGQMIGMIDVMLGEKRKTDRAGWGGKRAETPEEHRARLRKGAGIRLGEKTGVTSGTFGKLRAIATLMKTNPELAHAKLMKVWDKYEKVSLIQEKHLLAQAGLTKEMMLKLKALAGLSDDQVQKIARSITVKVHLDGKVIAISTKDTQSDNDRRSGKKGSSQKARRVGGSSRK
jgi:TP901 family phage tail tape measure protein